MTITRDTKPSLAKVQSLPVLWGPGSFTELTTPMYLRYFVFHLKYDRFYYEAY